MRCKGRIRIEFPIIPNIGKRFIPIQGMENVIFERVDKQPTRPVQLSHCIINKTHKVSTLVHGRTDGIFI